MLSGSIGLFFLLKALEEKIVFFYSPTETMSKDFYTEDLIRVGGIVLKNSVKYKKDMSVDFTITDNKNNLKVVYYGILPDLFREGQGVIVEGNMNIEKNIFLASKVLAKHDENYMPPELLKSVNKEKK